MASSKFDQLAAEVGSTDLAGYITTHNPVVKARADATRARHAAAKKKRKRARDIMHPTSS